MKNATLEIAEMEVEDRLAAVRESVAAAARRSGRDPAVVNLIVITKYHPMSLVQKLHSLGVNHFGENRHPEAQAKADLLPQATWHFVGQLQTNKARKVAAYADVIQSVDRVELVRALAERHNDVMLQIDLSDNPASARGGCRPSAAPYLAEQVAATEGLNLLGVMAVAPRHEPAALAFERLAAASQAVRAVVPSATRISAGMSGDYQTAVAAGATDVRIGTIITGPRPAA